MTMKTIKTTAILAFIALSFNSCNTVLINDLDIDSGWYCNIWGRLVVHGTITNDGSDRVAGVELKVKVRTANGGTITEKITLSDDIPSGGTIQFKEWLSYDPDEHPNSIRVVISDAW